MKFVDVFQYWLLLTNNNRFQAPHAVRSSLKAIVIFIGAKNVKGKDCE